MNYCRKIDLFAYGHYQNSYASPETVQDLFIWGCNMLSLYAALLLALLLAVVGRYLWKNLKNKTYSNLSPSHLMANLRVISKGSLADYITDSPNWRVCFYLYGVYGIIFGLGGIVVVQVILSMVDLSNPPLEKYLTMIFTLVTLLLGSGFIIIHIFLLNTIGAQVETLLFTRGPLQMSSLSREERKVMIRFNLKRSFIVIGLYCSIILLIILITKLGGVAIWSSFQLISTAEDLCEVCFAFFIISKTSFFFHERNSLQRVRTTLKAQYQFLTIQKFLDDSGPRILIQRAQENRAFSGKVDLKKLSNLQLDILEKKLDLLKEEDSIPMPKSTNGMVLLIPKIYFALAAACIFFKRWFDRSQRHSPDLSFVIGIIGLAVYFFLLPLFAFLVFHSKILLGEETDADADGLGGSSHKSSVMIEVPTTCGHENFL